jgi:hypothetical protein
MNITQISEDPSIPQWIKLRVKYHYASEKECNLLMKGDYSQFRVSALFESLENSIESSCMANCADSCKGCGGFGKCT